MFGCLMCSVLVFGVCFWMGYYLVAFVVYCGCCLLLVFVG